MKIEKGYKIVYVSSCPPEQSRRLFSPFAYPRLRLEYILGEWIYPKVEGSLLFTFHSSYKPTMFPDSAPIDPVVSTHKPAFALYECEMLNAQNISNLPRIESYTVPTNQEECILIWSDLRNHLTRSHTVHTRCVAEAVKLTKLVYLEECGYSTAVRRCTVYMAY